MIRVDLSERELVDTIYNVEKGEIDAQKAVKKILRYEKESKR